jgi:lactate permease
MLAGLGFSPFYAAAICLLANTSPVAFGAIGTPLITLASITGLPLDRLSAGVGRICAPVSLIVPAYLVVVMEGWAGLRGVWPAAAACGLAFAVTQFVVSNFVGAQLTDILASIAAMGAVVAAIRLRGEGPRTRTTHSGRDLAKAWAPYAFLVVFVLLWGYKPLQQWLNGPTATFNWPWLHNLVQRMPPVTPKPAPYAAVFTFNWLSASGTACFLAALLGAAAAGLTPRRFAGTLGRTAKQMALAELTLAAVLGLAFLMNYSGATATLGLAFAATGPLFPFFSAMLGWLGVFLTGSDTSANALFGSLQVVTAGKLGMNPALMAAANSSGGVMGKMISVTSIAIAAAATAMKREDEALLFRFTLKHSILLASLIGAIVMFYAYVAPSWAP